MGKYFYHMTDKRNLDSIREHGLLPRKGGKFGAMSLEAHDDKPKVFMLPILNGVGMKGFLKEWWHGDVEDVVILRVRSGSVDFYKSACKYNARHEVWCYHKIDNCHLEVRTEDKRWIRLDT